MDGDRRECFVDLHQTKISDLEASAFRRAIAGTVWRYAKRSAHIPDATISASGSIPSFAARSELVTTTAAAPSESCDAFPAVIVP